MLIRCCCSPRARNSRSSSIWRWKAASIRARTSPSSSGQKGTQGMAGQPFVLPCSICVICWVRAPTFLLSLTSALELDLHILLEAWTSARASTDTTVTMPAEAHRTLLARLQRAISLPRGEFLEGFSLRDAPAFDDWVRFQREYWHLRTSEVFDRLSQMQFETGELEAAMETVSRWLVLSPLHEDAYRRLMRLHFAAGDRVAALQAYDTCRARLSTGMQTEPTLETAALAIRMRAVAPPRR